MGLMRVSSSSNGVSKGKSRVNLLLSMPPAMARVTWRVVAIQSCRSDFALLVSTGSVDDGTGRLGVRLVDMMVVGVQVCLVINLAIPTLVTRGPLSGM